MTGMLKDWSVIPTLGAVSYPTLVLNGDDDEAPDSCLFYDIERASWVTLGLEQPHGILGGASQRLWTRRVWWHASLVNYGLPYRVLVYGPDPLNTRILLV